jgi:cell division protein FtsA
MVDAQDEIEVPSVGGRAPRKLPRRILCEIIEPRVEEMFALAQREIAKTGYEELLASGAVITGGTTILEGMPEVAEEILGLPVRRGIPRGIGGLVDVVRSPKFATSVGLVLHGAKQSQGAQAKPRYDHHGITTRVKDWFARVF